MLIYTWLFPIKPDAQESFALEIYSDVECTRMKNKTATPSL